MITYEEILAQKKDEEVRYNKLLSKSPNELAREVMKLEKWLERVSAERAQLLVENHDLKTELSDQSARNQEIESY